MALVNRFSLEKYQRRNWHNLEKTINTAVNNFLPPTTATTTELQTLYHPISPTTYQSSVNFLTLISHSVTRTSSVLLSLHQNLIRGRGFFCNACIHTQRHHHAAYAALIAIINSNHPQIGHLLLRRLVSVIKKAHNRHNYATLADLTKLLAHLVNQRVGAESLGLELVDLLLYSGDTPTDEVVTMAVEFVQQCGASLRKGDCDKLDFVLDRLRELLRERKNSIVTRDNNKVREITKTIDSLRMSEFRHALRVIPELDILSEKERVTHVDVSLFGEEEIETERELDVFRYDPEFFDPNVVSIRREIENEVMKPLPYDNEETAAINLRLKLIELKKRPIMHYDIDDLNTEICWMIVECCGEQHAYRHYFGDLGRRMRNEFHTGYEPWRECFIEVYEEIERFEKEKVKIVGELFGEMMVLNKIERNPKDELVGVDRGSEMPWEYVLGNLRLGDKTGSEAARVFIEALFDQLDLQIGYDARNAMLALLEIEGGFKVGSMFPVDDIDKLRYWIKYFKSIRAYGVAKYGEQELEGALTRTPQ